jgi:4-hydroxy-2-oxoglutarate aldolase
MKETRPIADRLQGVFAPVVTPFDARTGELDRAGFERNLAAHVSAGLHGVVVAGSTGEAALLDEAERALLVASARAVLPSDRIVVAGAGAESTRAAVRLAMRAAEEGTDAALALATHYRRIADESPLPVVLYNIPKYMHFALPPAVVAELAGHHNIVGIKDSSGDLELLEAYLVAQSDAFRVLTGNGSSFAPALARGATGGILGVATFAPGLALEAYEAWQRGDAAAAHTAQARLGPLASQIVGDLGVPGVKAALDHIGLAGGPPRPPLMPLRGAEVERVAALLRAAELSVAA